MLELAMLAPSAYCRIEADPTRYYHAPIFGGWYRSRLARCIDLLPRGKRVLEVGYGSGVSFLSLGEKYEEIHGVDPHGHAADVSSTFAHTDLNLHLETGSVLNLPYEDVTFDAALAVSIHEHLPFERQSIAFAEVRRVLAPGGCYVVGVPGMNPLMTAAFFAMGWNIHDHHFCSEKQVLSVMRKHLDVDAPSYWPALLPRPITAYVCARGWKR